MFNFLKKSKISIVSPAKGVLKDLSVIPDETFSSKCLGDGFVIDPEVGEVYSPVDGEVTMVFPTLHAVGLTSKNGTEILIHIGVDTVSLNGEGFEAFVTAGQKVKAGDLLVKFELHRIKDKVPSIDVIVVFTSGEICEIIKNDEKVNIGEEDIVNIKPKG